MCGLLAVFDTRHKIDRHQCAEALAKIGHRGPDDCGMYFGGPVFLGHRRLSILDLSQAGHQPMHSATQDVSLVFNGQVYNYRQLRNELSESGYCFNSHCDTEVVLAAYLHWGLDCFDKFRGMWAIVIWDARSQELIVSRDRIGLKPLYYYKQGTRWVLASEIKAILTLHPQAAQLDVETAHRYVARGWLDFTQQTFFAEVRSIKPGSITVISENEESSRSFWNLVIRRDIPPRTVEELREVFVSTVQCHLQSDVPIAIALSGGVDSGAIAGVISRQFGMGGRVHGFSICPPDTPDESHLMEATARHTGIAHTYVNQGHPNYPALIDEMIGFHDEPPPKVNHVYQYLLRRAAGQEGYKVLLSGEGADEILGGYARYAPMYLASMLELGKLDAVQTFLRGSRSLTGQEPTQMLAATVRYLKKGFGARMVQEHRLGYALLNAEIDDETTFPAFGYEIDGLEEEGTYILKEMLDRFRLDMPHVLKIEDRNGMAHGVEVRVPFLDHQMVEYALGFDPEIYMQGGVNKYPFRMAMRDYLAPEINECKIKMRRPGSDAHVIYDHLASNMREILRDRRFSESGLWKPGIAERFEEDLMARAGPAAFVWFRVYCLARWMHLRLWND